MKEEEKGEKNQRKVMIKRKKGREEEKSYSTQAHIHHNILTALIKAKQAAARQNPNIKEYRESQNPPTSRGAVNIS